MSDVNNNHGVFGNKKLPMVDKSVSRTPYLLSKRDKVFRKQQYDGGNVLNPRDLALEMTPATNDSGLFGTFDNSPYTLVVAYKNKLYGILKGENSAHIDLVDKDGCILNSIGNIMYDSQSHNMTGSRLNGSDISMGVTSYICNLLFDAPTTKTAIPETATMEFIVNKLNSSLNLDNTTK